MDSPKKTLVLISGKARAGKDTFAKLLKKHDRKIKIVAFAQNLKQLAVDTFGIDLMDLEDYKNNGKVIVHGLDTETLQGGNTQSYRSILQNLGNAVRNTFGVRAWANLLAEQADGLFSTTDTVVVSDWRFEEELWALEDYFEADFNVSIIKVRVYKDQEVLTGSEASDISEVDLDTFRDYDAEFNNDGSLEELEEAASGLVAYIKSKG